MTEDAGLRVWTIGHSSRSAEEFVGLLRAQSLDAVADVRRHPGSRAHPHFAAHTLACLLAQAGIEYHPFPELGGRRTPATDSPNTVWRNAAFRGYADYMETAAFREGLDRLMALARRRRTAMLCSEALWWRCHRALIADALKARGVAVFHVMAGGKSVEHPYTSAARIEAGRLTYRPVPSSRPAQP